MLKDLLNSRGAGMVAGTVTVVLGMGAIAALALGSTDTRTARLGDPSLNIGSSVLDVTVVSSSGANDPASATPVGAGAAQGTDPAAATPAAAHGASSSTASASASAHAPDMSLARSGSAEVYRTMLATPGPLESSIARLASVSSDNQARRFAAGAIAGGVGGATAAGFVSANRPTSVANNPYATGDVGRSGGGPGSDAVRSPGGSSSPAGSPGTAADRPAMGTQPVGPGSAPATGNPAASAPAVAPPVVTPTPPVTKSPAPSTSPNTAPGASAPGSAPGLVSTPAPVPTDALGEGKGHGPGTTAPGGNQAPGTGSDGSQPQEPGAVPPPSASIVGPSAVVTPEPSTWLLMGSGLVVLGVFARRRGATAS